MDKNNAVLNYEAPRMEIVETKVEKGFGDSVTESSNEDLQDDKW